MASSPKTLEQWKVERESLLEQIDSLELRVQQLTSKSSPIKPPVDGILSDFYSIGLKMFGAETYDEEVTIATPPITKAMMHISPKLQHSASSIDGIVVIDPKPKPGEESVAVNELVRLVFDLYKPPGDLKYLQGNFGPVSHETPPTTDGIIVEEGEIPTSLNGMILRNGPNPNIAPEGHYMWGDGDSMLHGIRFKNGTPSYVARYTKTSRFKQEQILKDSAAIKLGDLVGEYGEFTIFVERLRKRLEILDISFGITTANNGLVYHGRRIMALEDFGLPHVIYVSEDGDLQTLGINNYNGKLDHWLSPHPKKDPRTGEMFTVGSMRTPPYCIYRVISPEGVMSDPVEIPVTGPTYMHELTITKNYALFQELPLVYDPEVMKTKDEQWIYHYSDTKKPRYGILNRYATNADGIKWFEFDVQFFIFHNANAWEEEDGTIVLYTSLMEPKTDQKTNMPYIMPPDFQIYDDPAPRFVVSFPVLYKLTFDMKNNTCKMDKLSHIGGGFPKINANYMARKAQYVYMMEVNDENKAIATVKYDLQHIDADPKRFKFNSADFPDAYGGEVAYVPKTNSPAADEDDGYLIAFGHHEFLIQDRSIDAISRIKDIGTSYIYVIDAKTMEAVAKVRLPKRVPYGFHAIYFTEEELQDQIRPSDA